MVVTVYYSSWNCILNLHPKPVWWSLAKICRTLNESCLVNFFLQTRPPLLEPLKEEIELKYAQLAEAKELAKSCLSDWETEKIRQNFIVKQAEV